MTVDQFWEHVEATQATDPYVHAKRLVERLAALPLEEILDFDYWWVRARNAAYTAKLWAAAELIAGERVSDDSFEYFGARLILRGRDLFQEVVADPDSLAAIVRKGCEDRELWFEGYPAHDAWMTATASTHDDGGWEALMAAAEARHGDYFSQPELDEELWDLDDEMSVRHRLPRLATTFATNRPPFAR